MKALIKLAKCGVLPVLKTVVVQNGIAFATDLSIEISIPCGVEDGIYHAEGFGLINAKTDFTSADLPEKMAPEGFLGDINISVDNLRWLAGVVDLKDLRKVIHGIYFDGIGKSAVATNGRVLNKLDYDVPDDVERLVPINAIELAISMSKDRLNIAFYKEHVVLSAQGFSLVAKTVALAGLGYPNYQKVIPKEFKTFIRWEALSKDRVQQIKSLAKIEGAKVPAVKCGEGITAYGRSFPLKQNFPFDISFDLKYLAGVMGGEMGLNSPKDVVVVSNMDRTTVLMPLSK